MPRALNLGGRFVDGGDQGLTLKREVTLLSGLPQLACGLRERGGRYGLTALCIGMGMGAAVLWENVR